MEWVSCAYYPISEADYLILTNFINIINECDINSSNFNFINQKKLFIGTYDYLFEFEEVRAHASLDIEVDVRFYKDNEFMINEDNSLSNFFINYGENQFLEDENIMNSQNEDNWIMNKNIFVEHFSNIRYPLYLATIDMLKDPNAYCFFVDMVYTYFRLCLTYFPKVRTFEELMDRVEFMDRYLNSIDCERFDHITDDLWE